MTLAIFDLDNTLICGDSDHTWGEFLVEKGLVDADTYKRTNDRFFEDYKRGDFDIKAYLSFSLAPFATLETAELEHLRLEFMTTKIEALLLPKAFELVEHH